MTPDDLTIPDRAQVYLACDTGTFMSALFVAITSDHQAVVLEEFPNYRYVSDQADLKNQTNAEWATQIVARCVTYHIKPHAWADPNTQFGHELRQYGLKLRPNTNGPAQRVSVAREYVNHGRVCLTPWLRVLPYELEHAQWPEDTAQLGKFERLRRHDHTLVCLEHILSRRPRGAKLGLPAKARKWIDRYLDETRIRRHTAPVDIHLGSD